jgi:hypothetical protein
VRTRAALSLFVCWPLLAASAQSKLPPLACDALTRAHPGNGVAYSGTVTNDDYRLTLTIPDGLTGWGAAPHAPFHGFSIFLDGACIAFEVHIRLDLPEDTRGPVRELKRRVKIGGRPGFEVSRRGVVDGVPIENRLIFVELNRKDRQDDVSITLATPATDAKKNNEIFERLLASLRFY